MARRNRQLRRTMTVARAYPGASAWPYMNIPRDDERLREMLPKARALNRAYERPIYFDPTRLREFRPELTPYEKNVGTPTSAYWRKSASGARYMAAVDRGVWTNQNVGRYHAHPHSDPTHHLGPCGARCRLGELVHVHKAYRRRSSTNPKSRYYRPQLTEE